MDMIGLEMSHKRRSHLLGVSLLCLGACMLVLSTPANSQDKTKPKKAEQEKVTIDFRSFPARVRAKVEYGRKTYGYTPFRLEIEKDSGFRDIRVTAKGFITLNTRFHTFKSHKRTLTLTKIEDAHTLLGYKHLPVDAEVPVADAGVDSKDAGVKAAPAKQDAAAPAKQDAAAPSKQDAAAPAKQDAAAPIKDMLK